MSCIKFRSPDGSVEGFLHVADIYYVYVKGKRMYFEFHPYMGPTVYKNFDKETFYVQPPAEFWDKFTNWHKLRTQKQERMKKKNEKNNLLTSAHV